MPPLRQTRRGWENEHLATFLLSQISFLSNPLTVADDLGVDLMCTLFYSKGHGKSEQLIPKQSFAIQIKTSRKPFRGDKQLDYFRNLEVPFFVGLIDNERVGLDIYSGEILPDFLAWAPQDVSFILNPQRKPLEHRPEGSWTQNNQGRFVIPLPFVGSLKVGCPLSEFEKTSATLSAICTATIKNIAAKISEQYVFQYPVAGEARAFLRIQAGPWSIPQFRENYMLRLAEVFYNLRWIFDRIPTEFKLDEFRFFEATFLALKKSGYPRSDFVDQIYGDLERAVTKWIAEKV